jgi:phosphoglycolate phosphatase
MKYKLVIFDFDGTLADSLPFFLGAADRLADKYRFKRLSEQDLETVRDYGARRMLQHVGLPAWKVPLVATEFRRMMARDIRQIALFDGVEQALRALAGRGAMLAVVSSNSLENVRTVLGEDLAGAIAHFECGVSLFGKSAKFRKILAQSRCAHSDAIYIGDGIEDREAARRQNIAFGAVSWGYTNIRTLGMEAQEVFTSIDQIADRLT